MRSLAELRAIAEGPGREDEGASEGATSLCLRARALQAEVASLQELVCYLVEKNERLRKRLQTCERGSGLYGSTE